MPRDMVERNFPDGLHIPVTGEGAVARLGVDKRRTFCIYDRPDPESIRKAAQSNGLPVDRITKISVLDPYFYV